MALPRQPEIAILWNRVDPQVQAFSFPAMLLFRTRQDAGANWEQSRHGADFGNDWTEAAQRR